MSAVSFPLSSSSSEPVAPRRHAQGGDGGREPAPFSLPDEQTAETKPARREDRAEAGQVETRAAQKPERARDGAAAAAKAQPVPARPADAPSQGPVPPAPGEGTAAVDAQPKTDVGVLVAIAEAGQVAAGEIGEAVGKPKKAEGEGAVAADADGDEVAAAMPAPVPLPQAAIVPQVPSVPELPVAVDTGSSVSSGEGIPSAPAETLISAAQVSAGQSAAGVGVGPEGAAVPAAGLTPAIVAASTLPAPAAGATGEVFAQPASDPVLASGKMPHQAVAANPSFDLAAAGGVAFEQADAAGTPGEIAVQGHAKATKEASGEALATPTPPAETAKPAEAQPQTLPAGIDFSALVHARAAKPEALAATGLDQSAAASAQQQPAASQQDATGGQPTPLHVVPLEIGLRALAGSKRFDIRLDPAELGRIDVKLDISDKGEVSAKLVVDRVETLHLLQRDARTLERAFEQAGLKPSDAGVDISLRDQGDQSGFRQNQQQDEQAPRRVRTALETEAEDVAVLAQPVPVRRLVRLGGVDLSI